MNQVNLMGRLAADPETKAIGDGSVTNFTVVTSEKWKDRNGEMQEKAEFTKCQLWGKPGDAVAKFLGKGQGIAVTGRLQTRSWEKPDGTKAYATEVICSKFWFVPSAGKAKDASSQPEEQEYQRPPGIPNMAPGAEDDIPF